MKNVKLAVLHFLPIEKYPPVMNCLNTMAQENELTVFAISCKGKPEEKFSCDGVKIYRYAFLSNKQKSIFRYLNYIIYNSITFFILLYKNPDAILYFDTMSYLPVYWYKKMRKECRVFIHYHEYITPHEYKASSRYVRYLHNKECKFYPEAHWISQTNEDRLSFFYKDHPKCNPARLHLLPNYPPQKWLTKKDIKSGTSAESVQFKCVYVGALSLRTMFVQPFFQWIKEMDGRVVCDIYSSNYDPDVIVFLDKLDCRYIEFKGAINYVDLPMTLKQYNVGMILYKGLIKNYEYNAPNKLFEYLACNLDVWFPVTMKGCYNYITDNSYPKVSAVNFEELDKLDIASMCDKSGLLYKPSVFYCEKILSTLIQEIVVSNN